MRDIAGRRSDGECSLGSAGSLPRFFACRSRRGFTLIEVLIALVIIGLAGLGLATFSMQSYRATQDLTIRATAENLAQVTLEELSSMGGSVLYDMTHSPDYYSINFPENGYVQLQPFSATDPDPALDPEVLMIVTADPTRYPVDSGAKKLTVPPGMYHVLCNGQLLLGTYSNFFDTTTTPGVTSGKAGHLVVSGAVVGAVVDEGGTSDLFMSGPLSSVVVVTGPSANDYNTLYTPDQRLFLPSEDTSGYNVYKYKLGSGIYLEPIYQGTGIADPWQSAGLLVFASAAPHLFREVTITDPTPSTDTTTPSSSRMYQISVRVIWTFGTVRQLVEVTGGKADLQ